jgi:GT2 family glycosyltransferase
MASPAELSIVVGTFNRFDQLRRCIDSIAQQTQTPYRIYITDAGSSDGTIEYLQSIASDVVIPIFVGKKLGQAKAYNDVFDIVDTPYVCWLSDDNEVVNRGLDRAVAILEGESTIGMVALKTQDQQGPFVDTPYIGGISPAGILNVNQGVLPTAVLRQAGGFSEEFRDYGIDSALTAEVLFAGYTIVYAKTIALNHYRNWSEDPTSDNYKWLQERHAAAKALYKQRYCQDASSPPDSLFLIKIKAANKLKKIGMRILSGSLLRRSVFARTCNNILSGRYISLFDPLISIGKNYHLIQKLRSRKQGSNDV